MDSFGRKSKIVKIANIDLLIITIQETMTTLRYTDRAKNIKKAPKDAMIRIYQEELNLLKEGLVAAREVKLI